MNTENTSNELHSTPSQSQAGHYVTAAAIILAAVLLILFLPRNNGCCCCCQHLAAATANTTTLHELAVAIPQGANSPASARPAAPATHPPIAATIAMLPAALATIDHTWSPPQPESFVTIEPTLPATYSAPNIITLQLGGGIAPGIAPIHVDAAGSSLAWLGLGSVATIGLSIVRRKP